MKVSWGERSILGDGNLSTGRMIKSNKKFTKMFNKKERLEKETGKESTALLKYKEQWKLLFWFQENNFGWTRHKQQGTNL